MLWQTHWRNSVLALSVLMLAAGCANNETKPADDANKGAATTASATTSDAKPVQQEPVQKAVVEIQNPAVIEFDKMSVKLDEQGKEMVAQMAEKAEGSKKIVIWGFCDRAQIGNAEKSAIARASAVLAELKANGMKSPRVRIRYSTEKANRHAAEVHFD